MVFFKQDISNLVEIIEEFYNKDTKKLDNFKDFLNIKYWEDCFVDCIESEMNLDDFRFKIEAMARDASSGVFDVKTITRDNLFYYDYVVGGLLLLDEFRETEIDGVALLRCATRVNIKHERIGEDLTGFNEVFGVPILGVITQYGINKVFQYFVFEDDKLVLKTPEKGNCKYTDINGITYDINTYRIKEDIINNFYGEEAILELDSSILKNNLLYFKDGADSLVIDIIDNFIKKYHLE